MRAFRPTRSGRRSPRFRLPCKICGRISGGSIGPIAERISAIVELAGTMELEAKFRVDDDQTFPALLGLGSLGGFHFDVAPHPEDQRNIYFDTADRRLRKAQYGLRVRAIGQRR